jgi:hypothetical protein
MLTNLEQIILMVAPLFLSGLTFIAILKLNYLNLLKIPLDLGIKINNKRIFGDNKTFRGPVVMSLSTALYGSLIYKLILSSQVNTIDLTTVGFSYFIVGLLYSLGELPNSFAKRRLGIAPGKTAKDPAMKTVFKLIDTLDSLIFCAVAYYFLFEFPATAIFAAISFGGLLHLATDHLMTQLKLKQQA